MKLNHYENILVCLTSIPPSPPPPFFEVKVKRTYLPVATHGHDASLSPTHNQVRIILYIPIISIPNYYLI
jgi:hypothetical protein